MSGIQFNSGGPGFSSNNIDKACKTFKKADPQILKGELELANARIEDIFGKDVTTTAVINKSNHQAFLLVSKDGKMLGNIGTGKKLDDGIIEATDANGNVMWTIDKEHTYPNTPSSFKF